MLSFPKLTATAALAILLGGLTVGAGAWFGPDAKKADDAKPNAPNRIAEGPPLPGGAIARFRPLEHVQFDRVHVSVNGCNVLRPGLDGA